MGDELMYVFLMTLPQGSLRTMLLSHAVISAAHGLLFWREGCCSWPLAHATFTFVAMSMLALRVDLRRRKEFLQTCSTSSAHDSTK